MCKRFFRRTAWLGAVPAVLLAVSPAGAQDRNDGRLHGRVTEAAGDPIGGVSVHVEGTDRIATTDFSGDYQLSDLAPGSHRILFHRLGYEPETATVRVTTGRTVELDMVMSARPIEVATVTVIGSPRELAEVRERMRDIPGAVDLIETAELERTRLANFRDVLRFTPGVYIQPRFGAADESQLSIRGSGLRNNFHLRGVNVLVNGMPYRSADGFTDFESLELLTASNIQVYKGGNALRFGGSTLGGAINIETRTGYTAEPFRVFGQGGSYGFFKGQLASGDVLGLFDYYASYAHTSLDGYREFAEQRRDRLNAHLGAVLSDRVDLRGFYFFAHVEEHLPGSLTREELESDPAQANPTNVQNRWGRDYDLHHLGVQLRTQLTPDQRLEISPYGQFRDIVHPIFRVLDQVSRDVGAEIRYENSAPLAGLTSRFTAGFQPAHGSTDNRHFENVGGESGDLAKDQREEARSLAFYLEEVVDVAPRLSAVIGLRYDRSERSIEDDFLADGDQTDGRVYEAWMPKIGFLYDLPAAGGRLFGNVSRSFEPPLLLELNSFTVPGFVDLDAQDAWQFELGTRGRAGRLDWQVAAYDIELDNEILNVNVQPFPDAPFTVPTYRNAPKTRHYGLEAGIEYAAGTPATGGVVQDPLGFRLAYTFGRFEYVEDPEFEGNEIPGAPPHMLQAELIYRHPSGLTLRPSLEWVPDDYFVDSANTVENEGWTALGLRGDWRFADLGVVVFAEARNLTDETYSPAVTVDDASGRYFQPADGRSLYAGMRWEP
ncbi:MAG: TonB-dependent receptor domain-containing protein [Gemmatimonadota bacterium]